MITSSKNEEVKFLRSLEMRKYREGKKVFVIEGVRIIEDAITDNAQFLKIYHAPMLQTNIRGVALLHLLRDRDVEEVELDDKLFKEVAGTETPQGILAILKQPDCELKDLLVHNSLYPHIMMLNRIQDPGNLGTILRTAAGAGFKGAILTAGTVDLYNPKSLRATMGAVHKLPVVQVGDLTPVWTELKSRGYKVIAAGLSGENWYFEVDFRCPTIMVVGNEGNGIDSDILAAADQVVKIPMAPQAESLNVAVAAGILIYEGVKQNLLTGI